jgi:hypothetical protein
MGNRSASDEFYVLDLADDVLGCPASRQHRFEWLRGDFSEKRGSYSHLPVDGFWESLNLVVEFAERQHTQAVNLFDKRRPVSGSLVECSGASTTSVAQNWCRRTDWPAVIPARAFVLKRKKIVRVYERDVEVVDRILAAR